MSDKPRRMDGTPVDVTGSGTKDDPWRIPHVPRDNWGWDRPSWLLPPGHYVFIEEAPDLTGAE